MDTSETVNTAAVDATIDGTTPNTEQPTIQTEGFNIESLAEPTIKGKVSVLVDIVDFKPAVKKDSTDVYGWEFKVALAEEVDDDAGGKLPVGYEIPFLKVFTIPSDPSRKAEKDRLVASFLCALNGIATDLKADPGLRKALATFSALPADKRVPLPADSNVDHYRQWIGTRVKATLKAGTDNQGRPQIDLKGMAAAS